jgi:hypothetical protein
MLIQHSKTFIFFTVMNLVLAVFVIFIVPETKGVMLEEMDTLFGGPNHVEKGGAQLHIEDTHHAHVGDNNITPANEIIEHSGSKGEAAQTENIAPVHETVHNEYKV